MAGKITKISKQPSMDGGTCWIICFKMDDGKSARSWVYERNGNFKRWMPHLKAFQDALAAGREVWLSGLVWWRDPVRRIIDADSQFQLLQQPAAA